MTINHFKTESDGKKQQRQKTKININQTIEN